MEGQMKTRLLELSVIVLIILLISCSREPTRNNPYDINYELPEVENIEIEHISLTTKKISWDYEIENIEGFRISRKDSTIWIEISEQNVDIKEYLDENAPVNVNIQYKVFVFAGDNISDGITTTNYDNTIPAPENFGINQINVHTFYLEWNDYSEGESGFKIERKIDDEDFVEIHTMQENIYYFTDDINQRNTYNTVYYRIRAFYNGEYSSYADSSCQINFLPVENLSYEILNIHTISLSWDDNNEGEDSFILQKKVNSGNWSELAIIDTVSYIDEQAEINDILQYRVAPYSGDNFVNYVETEEISNLFLAPTYPNIEMNTITSCDLNWYDNSDGENGFKIDRKQDSDEWIEEYQLLGENTESFTDNDLQVYSTYLYKIYAYYEVEVTTSIESEITMIFPAPTDFTITRNSFTSCLLNWDYPAIGGEEDFKIERRLISGNWEIITTLPISYNYYEDIGLSAEETYEYMVYAYNSECEGTSVAQTIEFQIDGMVLVEGGTFEMGNHFNGGTDDELPVHEVMLNNFYIGQYEVTQSDYEAVMGSNPAHDWGVGDNYPIYFVGWYDAVQYCNALSIQGDLTPCYDLSNWSCDFSANGYRLPTEAEWEYASRGGVNWTDEYCYSGTTANLSDYAWYDSNSGGQTNEVSTKLSNQLDIYDMSGNVWEWCNDWYSESYYSSSPLNNPTGPVSGSLRVVRGGSWPHPANDCRVADRYGYSPVSSFSYVGFRILRSYPY